MRIIATLLILAIAACHGSRHPRRDGVIIDDTPIEQTSQALAVPITPRAAMTTLKNVHEFSLEFDKRCSVDWESQTIISKQPFDRDTFKLDRVDRGDRLPDIAVRNFSFKDMNVSGALAKVLENTEIRTATDPSIQKRISADDLSGNLHTVVELICTMAEVYCSYDSRNKVITVRNNTKFMLHVPLSDDIILAVEDALRGSNIDDIIIDWNSRLLLFTGNAYTESVVREVLMRLAVERRLIAYDINILRVYPNDRDGIKWQEMVQAFNRNTVKVSKRGVIGRAMVMTSNFSAGSLAEFLKPRANTFLVSAGNFIVPERWNGAFDIGRCNREPTLETELRIVASTKLDFSINDHGVLMTDIFLMTSDRRDIARYFVSSTIGDNILIIGIPTKYFGDDEAAKRNIPDNAELVILISPRIINIVSPDSANTNPMRPK
ncbi:MAG: hypothetical protein FWD15_00160 [Alphaproteobacteria bacterium]|nr:hypothetical protein [Alphaproteobacteria bacterium]